MRSEQQCQEHRNITKQTYKVTLNIIQHIGCDIQMNKKECFTKTAQMILHLHRLQLCPKQWHHLTAFTADKDTSINMLFILRTL